ncbi:threonine/serine exporter family protein [Clostridium oryzae]|uniref:Inner membrane protein YjjP n=1 Tax=Clostridium oryzae TaxID=1450648 RepID=A0A1V4IUY1_9CLOT|nr:threonine/serine exporter family protein [Clostridium oryzae]OPJ63595.1 inner membrane protein YjjP [Clostridium oryzae]
MDVNKVAYWAVKAGKIILENGGETYRVEDTIIRICNAFGVAYADSFVTPTGIMMSVIDKDGHTVSNIKRIRKRTVDLHKIAMVNDLSRKICDHKLTADEFIEALKAIDKEPPYSKNMTVICAAASAGFFTLMFGGNPKDFVGACIIGAIIQLLIYAFSKFDINSFFTNALGGAITALLALVFINLGVSSNMDYVIIGAIMLLVPGIAITNAIRDVIGGDLVSGVARIAEALLIAAAISSGSGIVLKIWISIFGGTII